MIELRSVTKTYRMGEEQIHALDAVDLHIARAEFVAIVGPSGSGKSTLANIIGGLDRPDLGQLFVDGQDLSKCNDQQLSQYRNKRIGFVFQAFNLQAGYTALENVALPLLFAGVRKRERKARAEACLRAVGLGDRLQHKPAELSGGQRQRVSIARALCNEPDIVIADEPTGSVDSKRGVEIMDLLQTLNRERALTLIVITHDENIARQAGRVLEMKDGVLTEHAPVAVAVPARGSRRAV